MKFQAKINKLEYKIKNACKLNLLKNLFKQYILYKQFK